MSYIVVSQKFKLKLISAKFLLRMISRSLFLLPMNVGKSKVMRCSRYGNGDRMHVILNGAPLEEADCFKYLESQVAADGGCERYVGMRGIELRER